MGSVIVLSRATKARLAENLIGGEKFESLIKRLLDDVEKLQIMNETLKEKNNMLEEEFKKLNLL